MQKTDTSSNLAVTIRPGTVILGIDPGLRKIGYGLIKVVGGGCCFLEAGLLIPQPKTRLAKAELLDAVNLALARLLKKYQPAVLALEKIYFGKNTRNVLAISELRGALLAKARENKLALVELSPVEVKKIICGYGRADKTAVRKMVYYNLKIEENIHSKDAVDSLAIALAGQLKQKHLGLAEYLAT